MPEVSVKPCYLSRSLFVDRRSPSPGSKRDRIDKHMSQQTPQQTPQQTSSFYQPTDLERLFMTPRMLQMEILSIEEQQAMEEDLSSSDEEEDEDEKTPFVPPTTVAEALDAARRSHEGGAHPTTRDILDREIDRIWDVIEEHPDSYVMTQLEFSIFLYYGPYPGNELAKAATARYWDNATSA